MTEEERQQPVLLNKREKEIIVKASQTLSLPISAFMRLASLQYAKKINQEEFIAT